MTNTEILQLRYEAVFESPSDSLFYQNLHAYIDIIIKTPKLSAIIDESEYETRKKQSEIWTPQTEDEDELDNRSERTRKVEIFSLFSAHYVALLARIYEPLEEYITTNELDKDQDPAPLLMLFGIKSARIQKWIKKEKTPHDKWDRKRSIERLNKWYHGKRKYYENDLRQFHVDFLTELWRSGDKEVVPVPKKSRIPLRLDPRTGDFSFRHVRGNFSPATPEFKVLSVLYNDMDYQASYLSLIQAYRPHVEEDTKSHKDDLYLVVRNIKEKLGILPITETSNKNIFQNIKNYGYRLVAQAEEGDPE